MWIRAKHEGMELSIINTDTVDNYIIVKDEDDPKLAMLVAIIGSIDVLLHMGNLMSCHEKLNKIVEVTKLDITDI